MKAVVFTQYGSAEVLQVSELPRPSPADDEVLIRVRATSINRGDLHLMHGSPLVVRPMAGGLFTPTLGVLGSDVAGTVEEVGSAVTRFKVGDDVFGDLSESGFGGFAEYATAKEAHLAQKPAEVSWQIAAATPSAALTALQGLRRGGLAPPGGRAPDAKSATEPNGGTGAAEWKVAINGASGGVGTFAVQLGNCFGATVTGICSTRNVDMVRSLGAQRVIDYTREDYTLGQERFDLILDAAAYRPAREHRRALSQTGTYLLIGGSFRHTIEVMLFGPVLSKKGGRTVRFMGIKKPNASDLALLGELLASRALTAAIDREVELEALPAAVDDLEKRNARGKVVVTPWRL